MRYEVIVDGDKIMLKLKVGVRLKGKEEKKDVPLTVFFTEGSAEEIALALVEAAESIRILRDANDTKVYTNAV